MSSNLLEHLHLASKVAIRYPETYQMNVVACVRSVGFIRMKIIRFLISMLITF